MILKSLHLTNFRNHADTTVHLSPGINIFTGNNAQGKTNLLEAIYLTCVGRGTRGRNDRDMIMFDTDTARVKTTAQKKFGTVSVQIDLSRTTKKQISINSCPVSKMGELMGAVNCVFFSPDELRLIKEAPADRRRFLDIDISQIDKTYFYALLRYNKILKHRNALLKSKNEDIARGLDIWDVELAKTAAIIVSKRLEFIELLKNSIQPVHAKLTDTKEAIALSYESCVTPQSAVPIAQQITDALASARDKDMRLLTTTVGPHRDDICITIDGRDVRHFASQGQQRTAALAIKLAELDIFRQLTGETPILLLDDVFSELDPNRQQRLLELAQQNQTIFTTTNTADLPDSIINIDIFDIKCGCASLRQAPPGTRAANTRSSNGSNTQSTTS